MTTRKQTIISHHLPLISSQKKVLIILPNSHSSEIMNKQITIRKPPTELRFLPIKKTMAKLPKFKIMFAPLAKQNSLKLKYY